MGMTPEEAYRAGYQAGMLSMTEIIRCEDCCFGEPTINGAGERCIQCTNSNLGMMGECHPLNWFCADGECGKDGEVE